MAIAAIIRPTMQHFFPVTRFNATPSQAREEYLNNYYVEKFKSFAISLACYGVGAAVLFVNRKKPHFALAAICATAVAAAASNFFYYLCSNNPYNLFRAACQAIQKNDEDKAIVLIKKGAALDQTANPAGKIFRDYGLAEWAISKGHVQTLNYLISIGYDFKEAGGSKDNKIYPLALAPSLEIAQLLLSQGAILSNSEFNPLVLQLSDLFDIIIISEVVRGKDEQNAHALKIKKKCLMIQFFFQNNLRLKPTDSVPSIHEIKVEDVLEKKIDSLTLVEEKIKTELKELLGDIRTNLKTDS